ncbi:aminotransferase-like domain-containing protein [Verrucosispora sioxanthis]|uniref:aminotransferase-like domain-containing protein n=1 Tax=Verrucosispora sioxanthis TaxID=2499994 RepID=UPI002E29D522|nr:PLP-dependent aminotransferase family protein [Verrucosispora sioxanthis]
MDACRKAVLGRLVAADLGYGDPCGRPSGPSPDGSPAAGASASTRPRSCLTTGVSQALGLLAQALRADGVSTVGVEDPGSLGVRQHLDNWRLTTVPIPVDAAGVRVDELAASGVPAVMLTPAHQFPTGAVLDGERRRQLAAWTRTGGLVIEDDYDAEHRYDRPPVPALRATLPERVCYAGSVSKLLAPALRIGWLLVPRRYRDAVVAAKRNADLGNAVLPQLVLGELITSGAFERQLRLLRQRHVRRRDAMTAALARHLPEATVHGAAAGLHLMVTLDGDVVDTELAAAALARGVKVQPLSWHCLRPLPPRPGASATRPTPRRPSTRESRPSPPCGGVAAVVTPGAARPSAHRPAGRRRPADHRRPRPPRRWPPRPPSAHGPSSSPSAAAASPRCNSVRPSPRPGPSRNRQLSANSSYA